MRDRLTAEDCMKALKFLKCCDDRPRLRSVVYGLHEESESLQEVVEQFKDDKYVIVIDLKTGRQYWKGKHFNKEAKIYERQNGRFTLQQRINRRHRNFRRTR